MKVILIGYRATGKTTVGRRLSKQLKISFWDTDHLIEQTEGLPIKDLIARDGWSAFRRKEQEAIASLEGQELSVVATGGGAILAEENRLLFKRLGPVIYLKAFLPEILERLTRDAENNRVRPQFTTESLADETVAVLAERIPLYESAADFTVDTEGKSVVRVADEIYEYLLETGAVSEIIKARKKMK